VAAGAETIEPSTDLEQQMLAAGLDRAHVSKEGEEFFAERPEALGEFTASSLELLGPHSTKARKGYIFLGSGRWATVYAPDQESENCIKVATPDDMRVNTRNGVVVKSPLNLAYDMRFMNVLRGRVVKAPEHDVHVPPHYAVAGLRQSHRMNYALLQQRLPRHLVSIKAYMQTLEDPFTTEDEKALAGVIKDRVRDAVGSSVLMKGVADLMVGKWGADAWTPNGGNTFVEPDKPIEETPLHVIDLLGAKAKARRTAQLLGHLR
jgi:hypothetical protein